MHKIGKYYKPFIITIIVAILFLYIEAMCDLNLPDLMSDIVNTGIQASGIESVVPTVISEKGLNLITSFMEDEDIEFSKNQFTKIEKGDTQYIDKYSILEKENLYILKNEISNEDLNKLENLFSISAKTMINIATEMKLKNTEFSDESATKENANSVNLELNKIYEILPKLSYIPDDVLESARNDALQTDNTTLNSVGMIFAKAFYEEVGLNVGDIQTKYILKIGMKMIGVCVLGVTASIIVGFLASRVGAGIGKNMRKDVFKKVQEFSNTEFNKFSSASLITRTTNDITQIQNITVMLIRMLAYAPIMGIGSLIMMYRKTTSLLWTIIVACLAIVILILILFKLVLPKIKIVQKLTDKINLVAKENLSGIMVVRAFGTQEYEEKRFDEVNTEVMKTNRFVNRSLGIMMPFMMLIMNTLNLIILWFGAKLIQNATIQVGDLMAVMQYGIEVVMSFLFISMIFIMLPRASVSANRIAEVLETDATILDPKEPKKFDDKKIGYVEFKNVDFSYPDADEKILENINFTAKPGETTAIIGATGSGKTTIVNLIPRLFDATSGEILVNGVNVKDVNQSDLHDQIGYVPQKGSLLSGTIASNLKYGNEEASDEYMKKCAEVAQASEFIENKEEKYDSLISQGAKNVSGGQKQRLSIARALVKNAPIYIFDDSFSALDFKTDANLRKALSEHSKNSTLIIVAQRVSTIMHAEQILVLDEGKIVGKGTHEELLKNCPTYYEIASSQLSKEELENGGK